MNSIGFVLITHSKPHQIKRLVERLNSMFEFPPIVMHHDFGKCPLPEDFLPGNVEFVLPHLNTGWAEFSVVKATVRAIGQMYQRTDAPDWSIILSGFCYPTKPASQVLMNLMAGDFDAHINGRVIERDSLTSNWHQERYQRYAVKYLAIQSLDKRLRPRTRRVPLPHFVGKYLLPFSSKFRLFGGSQWFSVNRRAAAYIADFQETPTAIALAKHYQKILFSEEAYFQSVLYNAPELKINFSNWVYLDWSEQKSHPKLLTLADLPAIQASPMHFARKVDIDTDSDLLDALDRIIDVRPDGRDSSEAAGALRG